MMSKYFDQRNWEPFVYQRLNEVIDQYKKPEATELSERNYVVFDFDNTSALNDIEDNTMIYMLDHLSYQLSPEDFHSVLTSGPYNFDEPLLIDHPEITLANLAEDIIQQYTYLYEVYIRVDEKERPAIEDIHQTDQFKTFSAKLRLFYNLANNELTKIAGEAWPTYWFAEYTKDEFIQLVKKVLDSALETPFGNRILKSSEKFPGKTGVNESNFETGLAFPDEIFDLYKAFQDNGIVVYVVSASPIDVVQTAVTHYGFQVPINQVFGMKYSFDQDGKITNKIKPSTHITKKDGKTELIEKMIKPNHQGKDPVALFGDSTGDYHMMTELKESKLNVLFNRYMDNETQKIVKKADNTYGISSASFVVQGRDENKGILVPSPKTIPLGHETPILTASEFKGGRSLSE